MRLIATSDWHLDWMTAGVSRFDDTSAAVIESTKAAVDQGEKHADRTIADAYLFLGDLTDPDNTRCHRAMAFMARTALHLAMSRIPFVALAGNHDVMEDGHGTTTLSALAATSMTLVDGDERYANMWHVVERPHCFWLHKYGDVKVGKKERRGVVEENAAFLVCLPYTARSHAYDPAEYVAEARRRYDEKVAESKRNGPDLGGRPVVVIGHLNLEGIGPGSETKDMPRGRDVFWPLAALEEHFPGALKLAGHYHEPQVFEGVHVVGSLERLTFGEEEDRGKGYLVIDL